MPSIKFTQLTSYNDNLYTEDKIPFVDVSDNSMGLGGTNKIIDATRLSDSVATLMSDNKLSGVKVIDNTLGYAKLSLGAPIWNASGSLDVGSNSTSSALTLALGKNRTTDGSSSINLFSTQGATPEASIVKSSGNNANLSITNIGTGNITFSQSLAGNIIFSTNANERLRVASNGNIGIGTSAPTTALDVLGTVTATSVVSASSISATSVSAITVSATSITLAAAPTTGAHAATKEYVDQRTAGDTIPIGTVSYFAASGPPDSWLVCNGQSVSRTEYDVLFARLGGINSPYGGVTATHFNVPDLRGEFIRGWDGGRGVDIGRVFGSAQLPYAGSNTYTVTKDDGDDSTSLRGEVNAITINGVVVTSSSNRQQIQTQTIDTIPGDTRPRNVAMLPCIKAKTLSQIDAALLGQAAQIYATKESPTFTGTVTLPNNTVTQSKLAPNVAGNGPAFKAYANTATSVPGITQTKVTLDSEVFDTNSNFSSSRFTPTAAGYYLITGVISISATNIIGLLSSIWKNGVAIAYGSGQVRANALRSTVTDIVYLNGSTDYVELYAYHETAGSTNIITGEPQTYFSGCLIRSA